MIYQVSFPESGLNKCEISLPTSKSISNRALIMQGLANVEKNFLEGLSDCDDTSVMMEALIPEIINSKGEWTINIGAAGTSMRFLTAFFATRQGAEIIMTGSSRMKERPIRILVDALLSLGAEIEYVENEGFPPLLIHGRQLEGGPLSIDGSTSSQYISALLMVAPTLTRGIQLKLTGMITSVPYIEMTLSMMQQFGITSSWDRETNIIEVKPQSYKVKKYSIEKDWSAASYWYQIATMAKNSSIKLTNLTMQNSLQGDSGIDALFEEIRQRKDSNNKEPFVCDLASMPDMAQTVIATCCALQIPFKISGLHTLRIKETDRVAALENELAKLGYTVLDSEQEGTIVMTYDGTRNDVQNTPIIATYKDHRMAMAFAPLCMICKERKIMIEDPAVVSKSYPNYWEDLKSAGFIINVQE